MSTTLPPDPGTGGTGQPAGVLSSWIEAHLREVQETVLRRIDALRARLQGGPTDWDDTRLARAVENWAGDANRLDFGPLRPRSVLATLFRATDSRIEFVNQFHKVLQGATEVRQQHEELARNLRSAAGGVRRLFVELDLERAELDRELTQVLEWLGEMMQRLNSRGAEQPQAELLLQRAEFYAGHAKGLHALSQKARTVCVNGQDVLTRRNALLEQLRVDLDGFDKVWSRRVGQLAAEARTRGSLHGLEQAALAHAELVKRLDRTQDACGALVQEEQNLAEHLAILRRELDELRG